MTYRTNGGSFALVNLIFTFVPAMTMLVTGKFEPYIKAMETGEISFLYAFFLLSVILLFSSFLSFFAYAPFSVLEKINQKNFEKNEEVKKQNFKNFNLNDYKFHFVNIPLDDLVFYSTVITGVIKKEIESFEKTDEVLIFTNDKKEDPFFIIRTKNEIYATIGVNSFNELKKSLNN